MIPELEDGVLPEGVHACTMDQVDQVFGRFQRSDRRFRLTEKLRDFVEEARRSGIVAAVRPDDTEQNTSRLRKGLLRIEL